MARFLSAGLAGLVMTLSGAAAAEGAAGALPCSSSGHPVAQSPSFVRGAVGQAGSFAAEVVAGVRRVRSNGLPVRTRTGRWDQLAVLSVAGNLPASPVVGRARCVARAPIGVATNGVLIYPAFDTRGRDLSRTGPRDGCGGTRIGGAYAYQGLMRCLAPGLAGYARDGFEIWRRPEVSERTLDRCHGRFDRLGGRRAYRYYVTDRFPYSLGCFRGKPQRLTIARLAPAPPPVDGVPAAGLTTGEAAPSPTVTPDPPPRELTVEIEGARPGFREDRHDYVTTCADPVHVRVASNVDPVSIDGSDPAAGAVEREVALAPGQAVLVTVAGAEYRARCLPPDFPTLTFERYAQPAYPHYLFTPTISFAGVAPRYVVAIDDEGIPVWWQAPPGARPLDAKPVTGGIVWARFSQTKFAIASDVAYEQRTLDGSLTRLWQVVGHETDLHDFVELPSGNVLLLAYVPRDGVDLSPFGRPSNATVLDAVVQEVTPQGFVVWEWNSKDHVGLVETGRWHTAPPGTHADGRTLYDIVHINAVEPTPDGVLISLRNTDAVYKIRRSDGSVEWKIGGTPTPEQLTVPGETDPLGAQHDIRLLSDGTVTVFDNGTGFGRAPRAMRLALDLENRTATKLESVSDPTVLSSACCGSARRAPNASWLGSWAGEPPVPGEPVGRISELAVDGSLVFSLDSQEAFSYRAVGVPGSVWTAEMLAAGMDGQFPRAP